MNENQASFFSTNMETRVHSSTEEDIHYQLVVMVTDMKNQRVFLQFYMHLLD
jgi:hypothetical protein